MEITKMLLTVNPYSRPGTIRKRTKKIAVHYVGNPRTTALNNRNYFNNLAKNHSRYVSSNYIVGLDGEVLECVPPEEIAYCTNQANEYSISIECCHPDATGKFTDADGTRPYALHCDYDILAGKSFRVENCILRSWLSSGVGFGLRLDGKMSFDNCVIESKAQRVALFGHDSANSNLSGNQYLSIKDCIIDASYNYAVRFDSQKMSNANIYLTLINNTIIDTNETPNSAYNNVGEGSGTSIYNFNNLINYHNDKKSHGNTMSNWNYVS